MKMARATEADIETVLAINSILGDIDDGRYPRGIDGEWQEDDPDYFDEDDGEHCRVVVKRLLALMAKQPGCTNRVIWGFHTMIANDVIDLTKDTLAWHPSLVAAIEARDAAKKPVQGSADA